MSSPASPDETSAAAADWRASVPQSYRSTEVREIAKVLASLEPGATSSSKLMLAMRFEDSIFSTADSLADYRKKLTKRLKKLQKSYVPTAAAAKQASKQEQRLLELKHKYEDTLKFVVANADKAVAITKVKNGEERANHLKSHTDHAKQWYDELFGTDVVAKKPMDEAKLHKLEQVLEQRLENIRSHVIKLTDPDTFLKETLQQLEDTMHDSTSKVIAAAASRRLNRLHWEEFADSSTLLAESLEKAQLPTPLPTRNQNTDRESATLHLNKMRAASQAVLAFTAVPDKAAPGLPRGVLGKCHDVVMNGLDFITDVAPRLSGDSKVGDQVTLEDAWTKVLELPPEDGVSLEGPDPKRIKTNHSAPVVKSRVLLTPGRKAPPSLVPALKQKHATLVRPPPDGLGSHLVMEFGDAFVMTIFLVPLTVTVRAMDPTRKDESSVSMVAGGEAASWTPASSGLAGRSELQVLGVKGSPELLGPVVEQRLQYASARATQVLRQCFCSTLRAKNDFEAEVLEGAALLQFVQLCRDTYMPNFQDSVGNDE